MVEDIFAHGMGFEKQRHQTDRGVTRIAEHYVLRLPAGAGRRATGFLEGQKKGMIEKRVVDLAAR